MIVTGAVALVLCGCRPQAQRTRAVTPRARSDQATAQGTQPAPSGGSASAAAAAPSAKRSGVNDTEVAGAHTEHLHTPEGIVTVTRLPKASAGDLDLPVFPGARPKAIGSVGVAPGQSAPPAAAVKESSAAWRLKPPKGDEWVLAVASFAADAPIEQSEQFYRKALGQAEVRRSQNKGETLIVLSRVRQLNAPKPQAKETKKPAESESVVVRLTQAAGSKTTTILVRRAVRGAPVKIEPSGELPRGPRPKSHAIPVSAG
jgi:catechol 2,3-dioxygenase-like lactoylglutathione lyase family enzyme